MGQESGDVIGNPFGVGLCQGTGPIPAERLSIDESGHQEHWVPTEGDQFRKSWWNVAPPQPS